MPFDHAARRCNRTSSRAAKTAKDLKMRCTSFCERASSHEPSQVLPPPRPVVPEDSRPEFGMIADPLRPEEIRKVAVLLHERVVLAGRHHPWPARQLPRPFAAEIRDVRRRTIEVTVVVPVAIKKL